MLHLDAIESCRDKRLQSLTTSAVARMCPYRQRTRFMGNANCILDRELGLWDERTARCAEKSRKRIPEVVHGTPCNHRARDMRSPHRATVRLLEHFIHGQDRKSTRLNSSHDQI